MCNRINYKNRVENNFLLKNMVEVTGIEPATSWSQTTRAPICATPRNGVPLGIRTPGPRLRRALLYPAELNTHMERVVGIEPTFPAWKAGVLPIYDTRIFGAKDGTRTRNIHLGKVALYH